MQWFRDSDRGSGGRFISNRMQEGPRAVIWPALLVALIGLVLFTIAIKAGGL